VLVEKEKNEVCATHFQYMVVVGKAQTKVHATIEKPGRIRVQASLVD